MEFGKTPFFKQVDFSLPANSQVDEFNYQEKVNIFLGTPQWNQKEWIGKIYPKGLKPSDYLSYYSKQFNGIELNSTHYAIPPDHSIKSWRDSTPSGFKFSPKISQEISHKGLDFNKMKFFINCMMGLGEKLGQSFMQMPEHFSLQDFYLLKGFISSLPKSYSLAIEFRHASFFDKGLLNTSVKDFFAKNRISTVITDVAGNRDVLHSTLPTDTAMIRFVGNEDDLSDHKRVDEWVERIDSWFKYGLKNLYFFSHQPDNVLSIELASYFARRMHKIGAAIKDPLDIDSSTLHYGQASLL